MQVARLRENCTCRYAGSAEARLRPPPSLPYYITYRLDRLRELKAIVIIIDMLNFKYGVKYWSTLFFFSEQSQMNGLNDLMSGSSILFERLAYLLFSERFLFNCPDMFKLFFLFRGWLYNLAVAKQRIQRLLPAKSLSFLIRVWGGLLFFA